MTLLARSGAQFRAQRFQLRGDCLKQYYRCHGGQVSPYDSTPKGKADPSEPSHESKQAIKTGGCSKRNYNTSLRKRAAVTQQPITLRLRERLREGYAIQWNDRADHFSRAWCLHNLEYSPPCPDCNPHRTKM